MAVQSRLPAASVGQALGSRQWGLMSLKCTLSWTSSDIKHLAISTKRWVDTVQPLWQLSLTKGHYSVDDSATPGVLNSMPGTILHGFPRFVWMGERLHQRGPQGGE